MALTITSTPGTYYSAHGDIIFTVSETVKTIDPVTYPGFRFIADVYVGAVKVATLKADPQPNTKIGVFTIGNIVRNYVSAVFSPAPGAVDAQSLGEGLFSVTATVKFGYEYNFTSYYDIAVDSARVYFNHYNGRALQTILPNYTNKPLTTRPLTTPVMATASNVFLPYLPTTVDDVIIQARTYTDAGVLLYSLNFGPTTPIVNKLRIFNISPVVLQATGLTFPLNASYYTVQVLNPVIVNEPIYRFNLKCESKYEVFTLHFLNRFGGFESREFSKVSRRTIDIEKQDFGTLGWRVDPSGVVSYADANNVRYEQRSTYSSQFAEKLVLNTDILTDGEYTWLADLVASPLVYIEETGYFLPVSIASSNYVYNKIINDKLTNLTVTLEFGQSNTQYR